MLFITFLAVPRLQAQEIPAFLSQTLPSKDSDAKKRFARLETVGGFGAPPSPFANRMLA